MGCEREARCGSVIQQYKAVTEGVLTNYTASYDQAKIATQAAYEFQGRYASTIMGQKTQEQGADIGIINFMRGFGRIMNGLEAGAGDNALTYADDLRGQPQDEVKSEERRVVKECVSPGRIRREP